MLKNTNFLRYYVGMIVSDLGNILFHFTTSLFLLTLTQKASLMATYLAITTVLQLVLQPFFGGWSDRLDKVKTLYRCDFVFGITDLLFAFLLFTANDTTWIIVGLFLNGIINSITYALYNPTSQSMVPLLVEEDRLHTAYSFLSTSQSAIQVFGTLMAAIIFSLVGYAWIVLFNGISYIAAALLEMNIKATSIVTASENHFLKDVKAGFDYMVQKKELLNMAKCALIMNIFLVGVTSVVLPFMINVDLQLNPINLAVFSIFLSLGMIGASLWMGERKFPRAYPWIRGGFFVNVLIYGLILLNYVLIATHFISPLWYTTGNALIAFGFGFCAASIQIPLNTAYAKRVESAYMGRVMALRSTLSSIATPFSMLAFGFLIDNFTVLIALLIGTVGILLGAIYTAKNKPLQSL